MTRSGPVRLSSLEHEGGDTSGAQTIGGHCITNYSIETGGNVDNCTANADKAIKQSQSYRKRRSAKR